MTPVLWKFLSFTLVLLAPAAGFAAESATADESNMSCCNALQGIPAWMFFSGGAFLLLGTFVMASTRSGSLLLPEAGVDWKVDFLRVKWIRRLVNKSWFPLFMQAPWLILFLFLTFAGLVGATFTNIAPVFTWTIWWGLLVFVVLFMGKAFCMVCPWDAFAGIVERGSLFAKRLPTRTLNLPWPKWAQNIYPATLLFIGLTWLELGFGVTRNAGATAVLGLVMLVLVVGSAVIFDRRAFCRFGCLIGRISGLYAMFAPIELRARKETVCRSCTTRDCVSGNAHAVACPTFENPQTLSRNTYCTLCTECVRACPHNNISLQLRPFGTDLNNETEFRKDESYLAIVLLALTSFHGLTMTPTWYDYTDWLQALLPVGYKTAFSILMAACIAAPIGLFWLIAWLSNRLTHVRLGTAPVFRAFAFPLIPIALFYHVAHNVMHFFREAQYLVPRLSDPMGWGWDLFGTAKQTYGPLLSLDTIWVTQLVLVLVGHVFGVLVSERVARRLYASKRDSRWAQLPMLATMILFSLYSLWLIHQPMEMRTGL
jgi:polyferredoxin